MGRYSNRSDQGRCDWSDFVDSLSTYFDCVRGLAALVEDSGMVIGPAFTLDENLVSEFCKRHQICRLAIFGSALREDFGPDSDVDLLVDFVPGETPGLMRLAAMERNWKRYSEGERLRCARPAT